MTTCWGFGCFCSVVLLYPQLAFVSVIPPFSLDPVIGTLPPSLGSLTGLTYALALSYNQLTGTIPPSLSSLSQIQYVSLRSNRLSGTLPQAYGSTWLNIVGYSFDVNQLTGTLPPCIGSVDTVRTSMQYSNNHFTGTLPPSLGSLSVEADDDQDFDFSYNNFSGTINPASCAFFAEQRLIGGSARLAGNPDLCYIDTPECLDAFGSEVAMCEKTVNTTESPSSPTESANSTSPGGGDTDNGSLGFDIVVVSASSAGAAVLLAIVVAIIVILRKRQTNRHQGKVKKTSRSSFSQAVSAFVPLAEMRPVVAVTTSRTVVNAEKILHTKPFDSVSVGQLKKSVADIHEILQQLAVARCNERDIMPRLKKVVSEGLEDFVNVYTAVWGLISKDREGMASYEAAVSSIVFPEGEHVQHANDVVELIQHGSEVFVRFKKLVQSIASRVAHVNVKIPKRMKRVARIAEKALFSQQPGNVSRIFDVVRGMMLCEDMGAVALLVKHFSMCSDITIVRVKNRFSNPTVGGWRDFLLCFYLNDDENQHVCEVQIVHQHLFVARKGLPGHDVYATVRNALELQSMLMDCRAKLQWNAEDARRAGFTSQDMVAAGFENVEIEETGNIVEEDGRPTTMLESITLT